MDQSVVAGVGNVYRAELCFLHGVHPRVPGNALDASDRDDAANIRDWPVHGMSMPDAIASWKSNGRTMVASANEGDGREYFNNAENDEDAPGAEICFIDESRIKDLTLDPSFPLPPGIASLDELQEDENLVGLARVQMEEVEEALEAKD